MERSGDAVGKDTLWWSRTADKSLNGDARDEGNVTGQGTRRKERNRKEAESKVDDAEKEATEWTMDGVIVTRTDAKRGRQSRRKPRPSSHTQGLSRLQRHAGRQRRIALEWTVSQKGTPQSRERSLARSQKTRG